MRYPAGAESAATLECTKELTESLLASGDLPAALIHSNQAVKISQTLYRENEFANLSTLALHATTLKRNGQKESALKYSKKISQLADLKYGMDFIQCLRWKDDYTSDLVENGRHLEAVKELNLAMSNLGTKTVAVYQVEKQFINRLALCSNFLDSRKTTQAERMAMIEADRFINRPKLLKDSKTFPRATSESSPINSNQKNKEKLQKKGLPFGNQPRSQKNPKP